MNINRGTIKDQAKQLIKGNVLKLFIIAFVVSLLTGTGISVVNNVKAVTQNNDAVYSIDSEEWLEEYSDFPVYAPGSTGEGFFETFFDTIKWELKHGAVSFTGIGVTGVLGIVFAPLEMALCGMFLMYVQGRRMDVGEEFGYVFKTGFDKNYGNKLLLGLIKYIIILLGTILFFVPGIILDLKYTFTSYIIAENPNLTWSEALKLSDKMTKGHKGELFVLKLSFIPWYLLVAVTAGIANIYFMPYYHTVMALYYMNFKIRGLQTGEINQADFNK